MGSGTGNKSDSQPIHHSMDTVFDKFLTKMNDAGELQIRQTQIGQCLRLKHLVILGNGFTFEDHQFVDNEIDLEQGHQILTLINAHVSLTCLITPLPLQLNPVELNGKIPSEIKEFNAQTRGGKGAKEA